MTTGYFSYDNRIGFRWRKPFSWPPFHQKICCTQEYTYTYTHVHKLTLINTYTLKDKNAHRDEKCVSTGGYTLVHWKQEIFLNSNNNWLFFIWPQNGFPVAETIFITTVSQKWIFFGGYPFSYQETRHISKLQ